jgi:hypothetical protein
VMTRPASRWSVVVFMVSVFRREGGVAAVLNRLALLVNWGGGWKPPLRHSLASDLDNFT